MKYFLTGLIAGALAGILTFKGDSGLEIIPVFYTPLSSLGSMRHSTMQNPTGYFVVPAGGRTYILDAKFDLVREVIPGDVLTEFSGNGAYYIQYTPTGSRLELIGMNGERYWQKDSTERPFLSYTGQMIFLLNSDHSRIRIIDANGNEIGARAINGRLCTSIEFSDRSDFASCGFADGTYYFINGSGVIINKGVVPVGNVIKGVRISGNGRYGAVHYGSPEADRLRVVDIAGGDYDETKLKSVHYMKTSITISDKGDAALFDNDEVIIADDDADPVLNMKVPVKRPGFSSLTMNNGIYSLSYTKGTGESKIIFFRRNGDLLFTKEFPGESFMASMIRGSTIFLRGSDSLFAYNIRIP